MDWTGDELAGVVDLFGGLTRPELGAALAELAFKRGHEYDAEVFGADIDAALDSYRLVAVEPDVTAREEAVLVAGPVAFPELPEGAADLPHILGFERREVDRSAAATAAERRFRDDAARAVAAGDADRIEALLDASYELEAWGPVDLSAARERLATARE